MLVLLPTTPSKLTAQWQGPYEVIKAVGKVNYLIRTHDRRKKQKVFHVNMLQKWHTPTANCLAQVSTEENDDDIPGWTDRSHGDAYPMPHVDELIDQVGNANL